MSSSTAPDNHHHRRMLTSQKNKEGGDVFPFPELDRAPIPWLIKPMGPPQPLKISVKTVMKDDKIVTISLFSHWVEWKSDVVDIRHVSAVACLRKRTVTLGKSPFENPPVIVANIESEWRFFTPYVEKLVKKTVIVENDRLPRAYFHYTALEGKPIFINFQNLSDQLRAVREEKARKEEATVSVLKEVRSVENEFEAVYKIGAQLDKMGMD